MKTKHKCNEVVNQTSRAIISKMINGFDNEVCGCNAKYFEDKIWYCGRHAPSKIEERETKSYLKWKAKIEERRK